MLSLKLALKNLFGAGLRTWLTVAVLSFAFVVIVFYNGLLDGWNIQARRDTEAWEIGGGQFWHPLYDRFDPFSLQDAHTNLSTEVSDLWTANKLTPVLITQATAYPQGRMINVLLKGIDPDQGIVSLPTAALKGDSAIIPALIGKRMAASANLHLGDEVLVRWRDKNGVFDAREITIVKIFSSNVSTIDNGQVWLPLDRLQQMTGLTNEATLLMAAQGAEIKALTGWTFQSSHELLKNFDEIIKTKKAGSRMMYGLLLAIALLAIFDTQILSIFRRQREIGTYMALGMTRGQVIRLFTVEGSVHSVLALLLASLYGVPLLHWLHQHGIPMPQAFDSAGMAIAEKLIPIYSLGMVLSSMVLVVASTVVVSYLPTRKIARMKPTEALKGRAL